MGLKKLWKKHSKQMPLGITNVDKPISFFIFLGGNINQKKFVKFYPQDGC
ncbi:MAG: hypothetical protein H7068_02860 [Pedobacter sp.]|nr:hypothetical protein [Chitinophagaceae bacterium]